MLSVRCLITGTRILSRSRSCLTPILSTSTSAAAPRSNVQLHSQIAFSSSPSEFYGDDNDDTDFSKLSNEELEDNSTIPGWNLVHNPPRKFPRGALVGTVVSDKMNKTVNVAVDRYRIVPKIRKRVKYTRKFMAHDEQEVASMGDLVMITPCHRISKHKHFMLREIIKPKGQL
jgi:small subunit ribosomal protein S17